VAVNLAVKNYAGIRDLAASVLIQHSATGRDPSRVSQSEGS